MRPLPPVGGNPALHGIEPDEKTSLWPGERVGHTVVYGTTRVGKTRLAELLVTRDIRRDEVTIVFDPKGDADLMKRVWAEAHRAGRGTSCISFILAGLKFQPVIMPSGVLVACQRWRPAWPVSCRVRGTARHSANLPAVRQHHRPCAGRPGERPDYTLIMRYVNNIADLYIRYAEKSSAQLPALQTQIENNQQVLGEDDVPRNMQGQPDALRIWAIEVALSSEEGKTL